MTEMPIKMTKTTNKPQTSFSNYKGLEDSLAVQWLGLHTSTTGGMGWIPGLGTKIQYEVQHGSLTPKNIYTHNIYMYTHT